MCSRFVLHTFFVFLLHLIQSNEILEHECSGEQTYNGCAEPL